MIPSFFSTQNKIGILGGGQLGKMLCEAARKYDFYLKILDPAADAPAQYGAKEFVQGDFKDYHTVMAFGADCEVLSIEIENVNTLALKALQDKGVKVFPQPHIIEIFKNKQIQKDFYTQKSLPTAPYFSFSNRADLQGILPTHPEFQFPLIWKSAVGGYDGKGVALLKSEFDLQNMPDIPGIIEQVAPIKTEIAVIVARNEQGEIATLPAVEMAFHPKAHLVEYVFCPADLPQALLEQAENIAKELVHGLEMVGVLAVEMFVLQDNTLWINECAPRVHNSGHLSIESCSKSQFDLMLRTLTGLPLGTPYSTQAAIMLNLTGHEDYSGPVHYEGAHKLLAFENVHLHLYGKAETRPYRKMGHITLAGKNLSELREQAEEIKNIIQVKSI